ncbi:MAG: SDR family oxidoreductase [Microbacterium sp.]|uniref:SDR family NAD(P)-dependent oxidoreductase n=1 Tax=Microbacterium sp. TaxID=51671 RepID=UPI000926BFE3|nr:SDR family oxidoreductase [Microbacterium sp.]OJU70145.1 MAG: 2-hydroxycyclohexanecarboxyl-CoA dehydrogenase [Microbacterium sp. 70-38]MBN9174115.1 SDR family oxidoreductase [Microbacterium sp.]MBN9185311.1 SDR family oxidoreductase [Microbacterium sp.]MBN9189766.1 SDR family oxidoreductase [Microbacterium sp.]MBN9193932.1 SDR family oxidoreductase [Microbacterium sp.]
MDLGLRDRVALVTGGASGIGRACVHALLDEGARVAIVDRAADGARVAQELAAAGRDVRFFRAELTDEDAVRAAVDAAASSFGRLDSVLGCAGISGPVGEPLGTVAVDDWDRVMSVNVRGNFLVTKHSLPFLSASDVATIVYIASDSAFVAFEGMGPYSVSKSAVAMLAKAVSVDHPAVRSNALCPGIVDTPMSRKDLGRPTGFAGTGLPVMAPEQIARHAIFLASPVSAPINATTLASDFGYLARAALGELDFSTDSSGRG